MLKTLCYIEREIKVYLDSDKETDVSDNSDV